MPRSRGGAPSRPSAPSRPTAPAPPQRSVAPQQQSRQMSTAPTAMQQRPGAQAPAQQSQSPGLFGQMASTAAGVAVGSSIGHAIGGFFGGGSSSAAPEAQQAPAQDMYSSNDNQAMDSGMYQANVQAQQANAGPCATDIKNFTQCMEQNRGDLNICGWYMEQLKACQQAAGRY